MNFILCSSSPRRIELLKTIIKKFEVIKPTFDESKTPLSLGIDYPLVQAKNKLNSIKKFAKPDSFLISCDTIVYLNNEIIGKPKDIKDAFNILKKLSNSTHQVISGYCLYKTKFLIEKIVTSTVTFNDLSDRQILDYINNNEVLDKAGAYAIQDNDKSNFIKTIEGSINNVIGFPLEEITKDLKILKVI